MRMSRKANTTIVLKKSKKKDAGKNRPVCLTFIPGKVMGQIMLDVTSKCVEQKKVIRSSQHGFTKEKSCLTILLTL